MCKVGSYRSTMEAESECHQCQPKILQSEKFSVKISLVAFSNRHGGIGNCERRFHFSI